MSAQPFEHENTPYGAYGEFEPVADDYSWSDHDAQVAAEIAAHDAELAFWDDDPNPYLGTYSEE